MVALWFIFSTKLSRTRRYVKGMHELPTISHKPKNRIFYKKTNPDVKYKLLRKARDKMHND